MIFAVVDAWIAACRHLLHFRVFLHSWFV